jgi:hypothetical protein
MKGYSYIDLIRLGQHAIYNHLLGEEELSIWLGVFYSA